LVAVHVLDEPKCWSFQRFYGVTKPHFHSIQEMTDATLVSSSISYILKLLQQFM